MLSKYAILPLRLINEIKQQTRVDSPVCFKIYSQIILDLIN